MWRSPEGSKWKAQGEWEASWSCELGAVPVVVSSEEFHLGQTPVFLIPPYHLISYVNHLYIYFVSSSLFDSYNFFLYMYMCSWPSATHSGVSSVMLLPAVFVCQVSPWWSLPWCLWWRTRWCIWRPPTWQRSCWMLLVARWGLVVHLLTGHPLIRHFGNRGLYHLVTWSKVTCLPGRLVLLLVCSHNLPQNTFSKMYFFLACF